MATLRLISRYVEYSKANIPPPTYYSPKTIL